ncbi:MAG TPA: VOC family protein [Cyclobacteriaceae bacterium]|nr:VOC family protein [Cyclobacteriaceae bacterium]
MATFFAPQLTIKVVAPAVEFYKKVFGAKVLRLFNNNDGSIHVAEMEIDEALFHIHEEAAHSNQFSPETTKSASVLIGLFVDDVHSIVKRAEENGAKIISPLTDWEYGYRQCTFLDPFGHQWIIEKKI